MSQVSLLFPAFNRLEFTQQSWAALVQNTNWYRVGQLHIYDDGSTDGTREFLREMYASFQPMSATQFFFHDTVFRSPMGVTLDWIKRCRSAASPAILAKLDNDTIYPPGWLDIALDVMNRTPELDTLGLECMRKPATMDQLLHPQEFAFLPAKFISGLGLYRRSVFAESLPQNGGYYGLEEWQQERQLKCGWILPSLPTILLDRMPIEPWKSLSETYVKNGWQRPWSLELRYQMDQHDMWDWWKPDTSLPSAL